MLAKIDSACLTGLEAARVQVEVSLARGLPSLSIVGLPDASVREAKDRVVAAVRNSGFEFPSRRVTINLAPADLRKEGGAFDVGMALGVLLSSESILPPRWPRCIWLGELALDGGLRPVRGALALVRSLARQGWTSFAVPASNLAEIAYLRGVDIHGFHSLRQIVGWLSDQERPVRLPPPECWKPSVARAAVDLSYIKGQSLAKRALEIAAAGGHNVLMIGPPGTGKSMLAHAFPGLLPEWTLEEALEATEIHSISQVLPSTGLLGGRPFRSPHHATSTAALIGGGDYPGPGEISLAHRGVLFLDELPEFRRDALEALRQPLEEGAVHILRTRGRATFPAEFQLVAAMNPCPCGNRGHPLRECLCTEPGVRKYVGKVSSPLLDRIDLHVELPVLSVEELFADQAPAETSAQVRRRVEKARARQLGRATADDLRAPWNARYRTVELRRHCSLDADSQRLLKAVVNRLGLSARAFDRIRRVARTIADLEGAEKLRERHVAEAVQFRSMDRRQDP